MRHTGVKPYECRVCQKRFFRKDHLAEHFTTHSKTLPYHCPICNRGFQRQIAMRAHFQNEHVGQHDMVKSCPLCNYRAATMKCLRLHFFNRSELLIYHKLKVIQQIKQPRCTNFVVFQAWNRPGQSRAEQLDVSDEQLHSRGSDTFCSALRQR